MKIGILGPTNIRAFCSRLGIEEFEYLAKVEKIAAYLASNMFEIVIVPHRNSLSEYFARVYMDNKGKKVHGVYPEQDMEFGVGTINVDICDQYIKAENWREVPELLDQNSDALLCLGFGPGTLIEICYTKWYPVKKIIVIKDFVSSRLPVELESKLPIGYIDAKDMVSLASLKNL